MEVAHTLITVGENIFIGLLFGMSTVIAMAYLLSYKYEDSKKGFGYDLTQTSNAILRLGHFWYFVLAVFLFFLYGVFDGVNEAFIEYFIKMLVLIINGIIIYSMKIEKIKIHTGIALLTAGWYFLITYHSITLFIVSEGLLFPFISYITYLIIFYIIFELINLKLIK